MAMDAMQEKPVAETIRDHYADIFQAERKVADYILENPEKAVNANVAQLATSSGVSEATVIRLCKHIGYQGYYQMRICLSRDLGRKQMDEMDLPETRENTVESVFQAFSQNLLSVAKNIDEIVFQECVRLIMHCNTVHIAALGNTSLLAQYAGFHLGRHGIRCTYNMVPEYFLNQIALAREDDIVLAISQRGMSEPVIKAMNMAREKGIKTIAITDYKYSTVSKLADYVLLSGTELAEKNYYKTYSYLCEIGMIDALLHFINLYEKEEN